MRHGTMLRMKREHHEKLEAERTRRVGSSNLQHFVEKVQRTLEPDARCIPNFKELYLFDLLTTSELSLHFLSYLWLRNCLTASPNKVQMKEELEKRQKEAGSKVFC